MIELLIVISIMAVIAVISFYAIGPGNNNEAVANAQLEFVTNLRSLVNEVNNGAGGNNQYVFIDTSLRQYSFYKNDGTLMQTVPLPNNVKISLSGGWPQIYICPANPNLTQFTHGSGISYCSQCVTGTYFACQTDGSSSYNPVSGPPGITVTFTSTTNSAIFKKVLIEGNGMTISRITPL